ncbi:MAG: molybdopterin molybdotransferase MoeA, partial [Deltaproteobacteria bacterium]|nr:molybdopterin molybdotransferase MoeA [Deltaproteobacteria bacterium]
ERVGLEKAFGRVLSRDVLSPEDLPGFRRSSVDGYAVRAKDTFGASESLPVFLEVAGEILMGEVPSTRVEEGQAARISTGGMLPEGADGVVMVEYCHNLDERTIEVSKAISPEENVIQPDDDFKKGTLVLPEGHLLRPQDLGVLAGLGFSSVYVYERPKVGIISTGDEVVPIDREPLPGQVRDINSYTLSAFCRQMGAVPIMLGLCKDRFESLKELVQEGLENADTLWLSGGSSVGTRDLTLKVFESFPGMELLVHGISISPGKPTIIARIGEKAIFGLPGHTASAMVVAEVFLAPFLMRLSGERIEEGSLHHEVQVELGRNIESASGREEYVRVKLIKKGDGKLVAEPLFGKSGLISTLVEADGLLRIEKNREGLYQGESVKVMIFQEKRG